MRCSLSRLLRLLAKGIFGAPLCFTADFNRPRGAFESLWRLRFVLRLVHEGHLVWPMSSLRPRLAAPAELPGGAWRLERLERLGVVPVAGAVRLQSPCGFFAELWPEGGRAGRCVALQRMGRDYLLSHSRSAGCAALNGHVA